MPVSHSTSTGSVRPARTAASDSPRTVNSESADTLNAQRCISALSRASLASPTMLYGM